MNNRSLHERLFMNETIPAVHILKVTVAVIICYIHQVFLLKFNNNDGYKYCISALIIIINNREITWYI